MNQVDLVVLTFVLFGGWLGAVKGPLRAFVSLSGTVMGLAVASLYGAKVVTPWYNALAMTVGKMQLEFPWVAAVSTQTAWQQSAHYWLDDLVWPHSLKRLVADGWARLPSGEGIIAFSEAVERSFVVALANISALIFLLLLTKAVVALISGITFRIALSETQALSPVGFIAGLVQSCILVLIALALLVPFFLWVGQVPLSQTLQPSFAWRAVQWLWNSILRA
ncbi:MAG: hypothetical protein ACOX2K_11095 [Bacillota bacterium]|jgi:hypothetical protein